jgi:hypothetical protein
MRLASTIPTSNVHHALVLDDDTKAALTIQHRPLNMSAKIEVMGVYLKAVWTGSGTVPGLQDLVEATWCVDYIESFAANVQGADVDRLNEVVAVIEVMEG